MSGRRRPERRCSRRRWGLLVERGYAGTSSRLAAERAGVSLGALQHHFRTRANISVEALGSASARLAEEFVATSTVSGDMMERFGSILDRLFVVFRGPTFAAAVEIHLASRTDSDLQAAVLTLNRDVEVLILKSAGDLLPEVRDDPDFAALISTSVSAVRGLALTMMTPLRDGDAGGCRYVSTAAFIPDRRSGNGMSERLPPGPRGLDNARFVLETTRDFMKPLKMASEYGEVASTHDRGRHIVAISGSEAARHVLVSNQDNYGKGIEYELLRIVLGEGLFTSEGELWRRQRKLVSRCLQSHT